MGKESVRVLITCAAEQIRYALAPLIARGLALGPDQPVIVQLLDIPPAAESLNDVKVELIDAAYPLLKGLSGCKPCKHQCTELEGVRPSIPEKNITCLTRLDHNRALGQIAERLNIPVSTVKNSIIWGNHSSSQYPHVHHAVISTAEGDKPVRREIKGDAWLDGDFIKIVQQRGAAIIKACKLSCAFSAASSAVERTRDWVLGTLKGTFVSMGVYSDGSYKVPAGLIYSFPVREWGVANHSRHGVFTHPG
ncbi:unnamed protein product [Calypogeia fissa]